MKRLIFIFLLIFPIFAHADRLSEDYYQTKWCNAAGGQKEKIMPDQTRCDCLTETHAVEFDFGKKWAEAIGQSLHYSKQTGKRAGVVLILEKPNHLRYWIRLNNTINYHNLPIDSWKIEAYK